MDSDQGIVEAADVRDAASQAEAAAVGRILLAGLLYREGIGVGKCVQRVTQMRRISCKKHASHAEGRSAALLQFVRRDIGDLVLMGFWVAWKDFFVAFRLARDIFFTREVGDIFIRDAV